MSVLRRFSPPNIIIILLLLINNNNICITRLESEKETASVAEGDNSEVYIQLANQFTNEPLKPQVVRAIVYTPL